MSVTERNISVTGHKAEPPSSGSQVRMEVHGTGKARSPAENRRIGRGLFHVDVHWPNVVAPWRDVRTSWRYLMLAFGLLGGIVASAKGQSVSSGGSANLQISEIIEGMAKSHERLLHIKDGLTFKFRVDSEQRKTSPYFLYPDGIDGDFRLKWPKVRNEFKGKMHGIIELDKNGQPVKVARMRHLISGYDFDAKTSVTIEDGIAATIIGNRANDTSQSVYPLSLRHMVEFSELYFPGDTLKTDYWLPNALEQHAYSITGSDLVEGIRCLVVAREGIDKLWIAPEHGYTVMQRELRWGVGQPFREKLWASELKEIAPGVWLPLKIVRDDFDKDNSDKRLVRYLVTVKDLQVGQVSDQQMEVVIPEGIRLVKDHATGVVSYLGTEEGDEQSRLLSAIEGAKHRVPPKRMQAAFRVAAFVLVHVVLGLGIVMLFIRRRRAALG